MHYILLFSKLKTYLYDEWQTYTFWILFTADIVGAARATEDPRNICLSEPVAPIMKFLTRDLANLKEMNSANMGSPLALLWNWNLKGEGRYFIEINSPACVARRRFAPGSFTPAHFAPGRLHPEISHLKMRLLNISLSHMYVWPWCFSRLFASERFALGRCASALWRKVCIWTFGKKVKTVRTIKTHNIVCCCLNKAFLDSLFIRHWWKKQYHKF